MSAPIVIVEMPKLRVREHIALDRALMPQVGAGVMPPLVRIWEFCDEAVVVGVGQHAPDYVHLEACAADGIPVLRRFSGGGTVCLLRGCVVFSVIMPLGGTLKAYDVTGAYRHVLSFAIDRFRRLNIPVDFQPPCDLVVGDRKIAGNAQAQKRGAVLVHGSVLVDVDVKRMDRYLKHPGVEPAYRAGRAHAAFVRNLSELGLSEAAVVDLLRSAWATDGIRLSLPEALLEEALAHCGEWVTEVGCTT